MEKGRVENKISYAEATLMFTVKSTLTSSFADAAAQISKSNSLQASKTTVESDMFL